MKRFCSIYLIALFFTSPSAYALGGCRYVSPDEKYYNAIRVVLTQNIESKKLRNTLLATTQSIRTYHKHHKQAQGFGFIAKIKHACTPSNDYAAQLSTFLQPKNALKNRSYRSHNEAPRRAKKHLNVQDMLSAVFDCGSTSNTPKNRSHKNASSWTEAYDEAKIAALIPVMIHRKVQELQHENPTKTIYLLSNVLTIFDRTAHDIQAELKSEKAKLFKNIGDDEDRKRDQFAKNRLSAVSKLLSSAQAQSRQAQEALQAVELQRASHQTQTGYALLAVLFAGLLYFPIYNDLMGAPQYINQHPQEST